MIIEGCEGVKWELGLALFLGWENGIGVPGTGIWPLGMGNEVLKNGIEIMPVDFQFFAPLKFVPNKKISSNLDFPKYLLLVCLAQKLY